VPIEALLFTRMQQSAMVGRDRLVGCGHACERGVRSGEISSLLG